MITGINSDTEKRNMLTTYQATLIVSGYLKSHYEILGEHLDLAEGESNYPIATFWQFYEKHRDGYGSVDRETGFFEVKINPKGLIDFWNIASRVRVHTTNR